MKLSEEQCNMKYLVTWTEFRATLPFSRNWERGQILLDFFPFHVNAVFPSALKPGMSSEFSRSTKVTPLPLLLMASPPDKSPVWITPDPHLAQFQSN